MYDPKAPPGYTSGGPFQYLGLSIDSTLATIAYKVDAAVRRSSKAEVISVSCVLQGWAGGG